MKKQHLDKSIENKNSDHIPNRITHYIKQNFEKGFLSDINCISDKNDNKIYNVDISYNNILYHLKFNALGKLLTEMTEPIMEMYDETVYID
jgi:hypothetical protein